MTNQGYEILLKWARDYDEKYKTHSIYCLAKRKPGKECNCVKDYK